MRTGFKTVDDYFALLPKDTMALLEEVREAVRKAAPKAEEVISYSMPAIRQNGIVVWYAAFKNHIGFYPKTTAMAAFKKELANYKTAKGTVQFPLNEPLPLTLITKIVKFRVKENEEALKKKKK
jgi:uncharacterized protein YdhG (YjbR/CyaY superfamily)